MGLLKSVNNVPGVEYYEYRDQLYFRKYKYRLRLRLEGNPRKPPRNHKPGVSSNKIDQLREWNSIRAENGTATCRREGGCISVFSNDLQDLLGISHLSTSPTTRLCTEAIIHPVAGVKTFVRDPKHKFRVYFKEIRIPIEVQNDLIAFLQTHRDVVPSRTLHRRLYPTNHIGVFAGNRTHTYFSSLFFLDYDDESKLSYMALMFGELLGKRYKLEKRS
jgi:hypothetical protein